MLLHLMWRLRGMREERVRRYGEPIQLSDPATQDLLFGSYQSLCGIYIIFPCWIASPSGKSKFSLFLCPCCHHHHHCHHHSHCGLYPSYQGVVSRYRE